MSFPRRPRRKLALAASAAVSIAAVMTGAPSAWAQLTTIDKGHNLLLNSGLQIWGLNTDSFQYNFNYNNFAAMNMNAVMWSYGQSNAGVLSAGQKWGKWIQPDPGQPNYTSPANSLNGTENAHYGDLVAIQVGDEQADLENPNGYTKAWLDAARSGGQFSDKLMYVNATSWNNVSNFINTVAAANPDALSFDAYPFGSVGVSPYNWLGKAQFFRRVALGSYIGATGAPARPYGLYLQTYHGGDGARDPGELEMRWQQFTAWTLGYTFADAFTAGGGNTSLFVSGNGNTPNQPYYNNFKESARQSKNLGPALVRLISYGYGPNVALGQDPSGATNLAPGDWPTFNKANAPTNQQYLTGVSAQNLGTKNGGHPGDVYVGFFNPLHASFGGGPAGEAYFMVTNALGAYLQDATLTPADCTQAVTLNFDNNYSGVSSLQRLRRSDGQVEIVPLTKNANGTYTLTFNLEGGTGDLFKYNDGTPFVSQPWTIYWDNDAIGSNNNTGTGAGLGGTGVWENAAVGKWYVSGTADSPWQSPRDAVFTGTAGTVTVNTPVSANSLTFKSNGYIVSGSTLTMAGPFVTTDAGVTATINAPLAGTGGITKAGTGALILTHANTYSGGTTVTGGTLRVSSDANLGAVPGSIIPDITLNGGTLQFGADFDISNTRGIAIGPNGGTIDTQGFSNPSGYNASKGGFTGPGDLVKKGSGTFFASATSAGANTSWTGRLIFK
jgi:autotransporter-associated beta strand protein